MVNVKGLVARLKSDPETNCAIINFITDYPVHSLTEAGSSLFIRGVSDRNWVYFYCPDQADLPALCTQLQPTDKTFALVEDWMLPILGAKKTVQWQMSSMKLVMPLDTLLPKPKNPVKTLGPEHAEYIYEQWSYADVTTIDYTRERLTRGLSAGIFDGKKLVAWAITHDDGALGFLTVLPEYRNRGYALDVTLNLIDRQRAKGVPSFVHIERENSKSLALASKLGFVNKGNIHWLEYD